MGIVGVLFILGPLFYLIRYFKRIKKMYIRVLAIVSTYMLIAISFLLLNLSVGSIETDFGILELSFEITKLIVVIFSVSRISSNVFFSLHMMADPDSVSKEDIDDK
jgi:hypothetical protein